jgi:hypothetical protein
MIRSLARGRLGAQRHAPVARPPPHPTYRQNNQRHLCGVPAPGSLPQPPAINLKRIHRRRHSAEGAARPTRIARSRAAPGATSGGVGRRLQHRHRHMLAAGARGAQQLSPTNCRQANARRRQRAAVVRPGGSGWREVRRVSDGGGVGAVGAVDRSFGVPEAPRPCQTRSLWAPSNATRIRTPEIEGMVLVILGLLV